MKLERKNIYSIEMQESELDLIYSTFEIILSRYHGNDEFGNQLKSLFSHKRMATMKRITDEIFKVKMIKYEKEI